MPALMLTPDAATPTSYLCWAAALENSFTAWFYPYMANGSLQDRLQSQVRGWVMVKEQDQAALVSRIKHLKESRGEGGPGAALHGEELGQDR